jgi:hypothetical protein
MARDAHSTLPSLGQTGYRQMKLNAQGLFWPCFRQADTPEKTERAGRKAHGLKA